jgi:hypothetical protein
MDDSRRVLVGETMATQCAMKMNQIRPLTTRATATNIIIFCNMSIFFLLINNGRRNKTTPPSGLSYKLSSITIGFQWK